jgi:hypothetical protein
MSALSSPPFARRVRQVTAVVLTAVATPLSMVQSQRVLTVIARDTALEASPTVPAGVTTVRLVVEGSTRRELVVHRVPGGTAPETLVRGAAGRPSQWFQRWSFGGPAVPRDSQPDASVTLDLRPGRYVLVAYEVDALGRAKGNRFLWQPLAAIAAAVLIPGRFPVPDATVKVRDSRVDVIGTMRGGQRTLQVENIGSRAHELVIGRLKPGKTLEDVRRWDRRESDPPPFEYVGGVTPMSSGMTAQVRLVLQSGTHVVLCPMRGVRGRDHDYEQGVLTSFKVN